MTAIIQSDGKDIPVIRRQYALTKDTPTPEDAIKKFTAKFGYEPDVAYVYQGYVMIQEREER